MENKTHSKTFDTYPEAYELYSEIAADRDPDRKNASISFLSGKFIVFWETK